MLTGIGSRLGGARLEGTELTLVQGRDLPGFLDTKGGKVNANLYLDFP